MNLSPEVIAWLGQLPLPITIIILLLIAGAKKKWVFGWTYDEKVAECERLRETSDRVVKVLEQNTRRWDELSKYLAKGPHRDEPN